MVAHHSNVLNSGRCRKRSSRTELRLSEGEWKEESLFRNFEQSLQRVSKNERLFHSITRNRNINKPVTFYDFAGFVTSPQCYAKSKITFKIHNIPPPDPLSLDRAIYGNLRSVLFLCQVYMPPHTKSTIFLILKGTLERNSL